jgi:hypothetical protein
MSMARTSRSPAEAIRYLLVERFGEESRIDVAIAAFIHALRRGC